jgi:hypothetical protein
MSYKHNNYEICTSVTSDGQYLFIRVIENSSYQIFELEVHHTALSYPIKNIVNLIDKYFTDDEDVFENGSINFYKSREKLLFKIKYENDLFKIEQDLTLNEVIKDSSFDKVALNRKIDEVSKVIMKRDDIVELMSEMGLAIPLGRGFIPLDTVQLFIAPTGYGLSDNITDDRIIKRTFDPSCFNKCDLSSPDNSWNIYRSTLNGNPASKLCNIKLTARHSDVYTSTMFNYTGKVNINPITTLKRLKLLRGLKTLIIYVGTLHQLNLKHIPASVKYLELIDIDYEVLSVNDIKHLINLKELVFKFELPNKILTSGSEAFKHLRSVNPDIKISIVGYAELKTCDPASATYCVFS